MSAATTPRHDELVERVLRLYRPEVIREAARRLEARRRRDAGTVAVTERDVTALRFVGEQYGVRTDALAVLLARLSPAPARLAPDAESGRPGRLSDRSVRTWVERMERDGYLIRRRVLGHTWVSPTVAGMALAGLTFERWRFGGARDGEEGWGLDHVHAITRVRLHLQPDPGRRRLDQRARHPPQVGRDRRPGPPRRWRPDPQRRAGGRGRGRAAPQEGRPLRRHPARRRPRLR